MKEIQEKKKFKEVFTRICAASIIAITCLVELFVVYYSFRYTHLSLDGSETYVATHDNMLLNAVAIVITGILAFLFYFLYKSDKTEKILKTQKIIERVLFFTALILATGIGFVWVKIAHIQPEGDQLLVYALAGSIFKGDYGPMGPGGYLYMCPHQFGLIAILSALYRFFGFWNYESFEYLNACCMPLIVISGYQITKLVSKKKAAPSIFLVLFICCLPVYLYLPYVYGEIGALAFSAAFVWQVISFCKEYRWINIVFGTICATIAYEFRMNTLIIIIAALITLIVVLIRKFSWKPILFVGTILIAVFGLNYGVHAVYERCAQVGEIKGMPKTLYISMGLQDNPLGPGWYSFYGENTFRENGFDYELSNAVAKEDIEVRLEEFIQDKSMAISFFTQKAVSQWNEPTYDTLVLTNSFNCEESEMLPVVVDIYRGDLHKTVVDIMDRYQMIIYLFALCGTVAYMWRKSDSEGLLLCLIVIGGFLFSLIWEAKSRYILTYLYFMIPLAAYGLNVCVEKLVGSLKRRK